MKYSIDDVRLFVETKEVGWTSINPSVILFLSQNNDNEYQTRLTLQGGTIYNVKEHIDFITYFIKNRKGKHE